MTAKTLDLDKFEERIRERHNTLLTLLKKTKDEEKILRISAAAREVEWVLDILIEARGLR